MFVMVILFYKSQSLTTSNILNNVLQRWDLNSSISVAPATQPSCHDKIKAYTTEKKK